MRSGSTAEAREISVKLSSSRKPMDCGVRFWGWAPELYDVIAVSPHTKRVMASGAGSCFYPLKREALQRQRKCHA
ncbi:hypothetical protein D3C84_712710 [compost metagenome]